MLNQANIFALALGISSPWEISSINLDTSKRELNLEINFQRGSLFSYTDEETGEINSYKAYDTKQKTWRHMNFFEYRCYIHAKVPRVKLPNGKVKLVKTPWEGKVHGFTLLFEAFILQLVKSLPVHQVSKMVGSYDNKIWTLLKMYTKQARSDLDMSNVTEIGVDETAVRRGQNYVSIFVDLNERKTLFVDEGRDNKTVKNFVQDLKLHNGTAEQIESVSSDMSAAFIKGVKENLTNANIVFDKFHIIKLINEAVDNVRKEEVKTNPILTGGKYVFLKNKSNFTKNQKQKYEEIKMSKMNIKTFRAMRIREAFQQIYQSKNADEFETLLRKWYWWATHSRIEAIKKVAQTIKNHWEGIVSWASRKINNGILEGFNSLFQAAKAKARGYKDIETIKAIIYILTAKLNFEPLNSFCATHTLL